MSSIHIASMKMGYILDFGLFVNAIHMQCSSVANTILKKYMRLQPVSEGLSIWASTFKGRSRTCKPGLHNAFVRRPIQEGRDKVFQQVGQVQCCKSSILFYELFLFISGKAEA